MDDDLGVKLQELWFEYSKKCENPKDVTSKVNDYDVDYFLNEHERFEPVANDYDIDYFLNQQERFEPAQGSKPHCGVQTCKAPSHLYDPIESLSKASLRHHVPIIHTTLTKSQQKKIEKFKSVCGLIGGLGGVVAGAYAPIAFSMADYSGPGVLGYGIVFTMTGILPFCAGVGFFVGAAIGIGAGCVIGTTFTKRN